MPCHQESHYFCFTARSNQHMVILFIDHVFFFLVIVRTGSLTWELSIEDGLMILKKKLEVPCLGRDEKVVPESTLVRAHLCQ